MPENTRPRLITREPEGGWLWLDAERCPLRAQHTHRPAGYLAFQDWAEAQEAKGLKQHRCEGCHRWSIWLAPGAPCIVNGIEAVTVAGPVAGWVKGGR